MNDDPLPVLNGETYDALSHAHNCGSAISNPVFYLLSLRGALEGMSPSLRCIFDQLHAAVNLLPDG
ncbi:MAG: hypothetical protein QF535_10500 [Anaerolineales bacterium]|nr:hypothetical protein [Anaerolineales bacterium]